MNKTLTYLSLIGGIAFAAPGEGLGPQSGPEECPYFAGGNHPMQAGGNGPMDPQKQGRPMDRVFEALNLSEQQREQLKSFHQKQWESKRDIKKQMVVAREEFHRLMAQYPPDEKALKDKQAQLRDLENQLEDCRLEGILYLSEVLTQEQYQKFHELMPQKGQKRGKRKFN